MSENKKNPDPKVEDKKDEGIAIAEPLNFDNTTETMLITSNKLMGVFNSLFAPVLRDYVGASFRINNSIGGAPDPSMLNAMSPDGYLRDVAPQAPYIDLFFKENLEGKGIKCLQRVGETKEGETSMLSRVSNIYGAPRNKTYLVTDELKACLKEFMFNPINPNWDCHIHESTESNPWTQANYVSHVRISGLSLDRILAKIYGTKDQNGMFYQYNTTISNMIANQNGSVGNFLLSITRANVKQVELLSQELGMASSSNVLYVPAR